DFVPLRSERSVVHPRESKLERLQRGVIEASKQCGRNLLMRVHELADWAEYCRRLDLPDLRWLGDPTGTNAGLRRIGATDLCIAVGPEGGLSSSEVEIARKAGWIGVSLGPRVLRVETAALTLTVLAIPNA